MCTRRSLTRDKRREDGSNLRSSYYSSHQEELQEEGEEGETSSQQEEGQETKEVQKGSFQHPMLHL